MFSRPVRSNSDDNIQHISSIEELNGVELKRKNSLSCPLKLECDSPMDSPIDSPRLATFTKDLEILTPPCLTPLEHRAISPPPLRRERRSDYGVFESHFEDDVKNWFKHINNKKRIELIHILAEHIAYSPEKVFFRNPTPTPLSDLLINNDIKLDNVEELDIKKL